MPTALDNDRRSPRKLLRSVVARRLGRKDSTPDRLASQLFCGEAEPGSSLSVPDRRTSRNLPQGLSTEPGSRYPVAPRATSPPQTVGGPHVSEASLSELRVPGVPGPPSQGVDLSAHHGRAPARRERRRSRKARQRTRRPLRDRLLRAGAPARWKARDPYARELPRLVSAQASDITPAGTGDFPRKGVQVSMQDQGGAQEPESPDQPQEPRPEEPGTTPEPGMPDDPSPAPEAPDMPSDPDREPAQSPDESGSS